MSGRGGAHPQLPTRPVPYPPYDGTQPCRVDDPERYFPSTANEQYYDVLKARCAPCPFLSPCRDYAVSYGVQGFWAGMTPPDRHAERERLGIAAIPVGTGDYRMVRLLLEELDDGVTNSEIIARQAGCSSKTVQRWREQRQAAA